MQKPYTYLLLGILLCGFSACKKDYVCTCIVTQHGQVGNINTGSATSQLQITMKSVSKKTAKRNCISGKIQQSNTQDYMIHDCKLQ